MRLFRAITLVAILAAAMPAGAEPLGLYPVQTAGVLERFRLGVPTVSAAGPVGAVQVTTAGFDHGSVSLRVGVFNAGNTAANFGIENVAATINGQPVKIFTREDLDRKAKTRAAWATVGTIVATAAVTGLAAGISNSYAAHGAGGGFFYHAHYTDHTPGVLAATAAAGAGMGALTTVQEKLDYTLDHLAVDVLQTTTVDPGRAYGGRIVLAGADSLKAPYDVTLTVNWKGQTYPFTFRVTHPGEAQPAPFEGAPAPLLASALPSAPTIMAPAQAAVAMTQPAAAPALVQFASAQSAPAVADPYLAGREAGRAALAASGVER